LTERSVQEIKNKQIPKAKVEKSYSKLKERESGERARRMTLDES